MKTKRHNAIQDLLVKTTMTNRAISSQEELRRKLAGRGFHVTQATLSRDIRELEADEGSRGLCAPRLRDCRLRG